MNKLQEFITRKLAEYQAAKTKAEASEQEYEKFVAENTDSEDIINVLDEEMRQLMISKMQVNMTAS